MARYGDIYLGGVKGSPSNNTIYNSGVAFCLKDPSPISDVYSFKNEFWEIEVLKDQPTIVARSVEILQPDEILNQGYVICQKYLDLVSVAKQKNMEIAKPNESYVILFKESEEHVLRKVSVIKMISECEFNLPLIKDGKEVPPAPTNLEWIPAFRYYRLSRLSHDFFDSYLNLFRSFESLLSLIVPPNSSREKEKDWFLRALNEINSKIPLQNYIPSGTPDPVDYFFNEQYKLRTDLFHSKVNRSLLPNDGLNLQDIADMYEKLFLLWQEIAVQYYNASRIGGSLTCFGFKRGTDGLFGEGFELVATDDPTVPAVDDTKVSPLNYPIIHFSNLRYENASIPDSVFLIGSLEGEALRDVSSLHKFCIIKDGHICVFSGIEEGLFFEGIDKIECYHGIQLRNNRLPK